MEDEVETRIRKKKVVMKYEQVISIGMLIKEKCHLHEGQAVYDAGWSDQVIADRFNAQLLSVQKLRQKLIGNINMKSENNPQNEIKKLQMRVSALEAAWKQFTG